MSEDEPLLDFTTLTKMEQNGAVIRLFGFLRRGVRGHHAWEFVPFDSKDDALYREDESEEPLSFRVFVLIPANLESEARQ